MSLKRKMRGVFARWEESGLSLRAFGERDGVSYSKLQYWRRKFRCDAEDARETLDLAEVHVVADNVATESDAAVFEVSLGNGIGLGVAAGFDEVELRRLIGVLSTC